MIQIKMGDLRPDSTIQQAIWNGRLFGNKENQYSKNLQFNDFREVGGLPNFNKRYNTVPTVNGTRDGIPDNNDQDMYIHQKHELRPYVKGMSPYPSTNMVDIVPSSYNTNPMGGNGGYETNLASVNGYRPLAAALDDMDQIRQRVYDDRYRISSDNPFSAEFAQAAIQAHLEGDNNQFYQPKATRLNDDRQNDQITKLKIQSGHYNFPVATGPGKITDEVYENYNKRQRPVNAEDLKSTADNIYDNFNTSLITHKKGIIDGMNEIAKDLKTNTQYQKQATGHHFTTQKQSTIYVPGSGDALAVTNTHSSPQSYDPYEGSPRSRSSSMSSRSRGGSNIVEYLDSLSASNLGNTAGPELTAAGNPLYGSERIRYQSPYKKTQSTPGSGTSYDGTINFNPRRQTYLDSSPTAVNMRMSMSAVKAGKSK